MHYHHFLTCLEGLMFSGAQVGLEGGLSHMFRRYKVCMQSSFMGSRGPSLLRANATFVASYAWLELEFDSTED